MRRSIPALVVVMLLIFSMGALQACGEEEPETTETTAGEETATTEEQGEGEGEGDGEDTADTAEGEPVVFGVATALGTIEGADSERAAKLAAKEINEAGGVDVDGESRPIEIVSIDTREAEPGIPTNDALLAVEKLITEEKPHAIAVGAFRSEVLLAEMDLIAKHQVPYITPIGMTPEYGTRIAENPDKYKYMFRTGLNAPFLVGGLAKVLNYTKDQFGFSKVYFVHQDVLWATGTTKGVAGIAEEAGWEVVGMDAYPTGASDFSSSLTKAKAQGAEVIVPVFDMPESGVLLKQAGSMQVNSLFLGFISPAAPATAAETFDDIDGLVNFIFEAGPLAVDAVPKSVEFHEAYTAEYGEETAAKLSGHGPGPAYDSVYVLTDAIERAGSLEPDAISEALEQTSLDGAIGHIEFNENHQVVYGTDPETQAISLAFQWVDGERVPVFPGVAAEAEIQLPSGLQE